jgi:putative phosphoesterase
VAGSGPSRDPGTLHRRREGKVPLTRIGILSDTHGLLRPEALRALDGVEWIFHAGDVGGGQILGALERLAPVVAVRGNTDWGTWAKALPVTAVAEIGPNLFYLLHDLDDLDLNPAAAGMRAVVSGHTHSPLVREADGVLYVNPGSAGPVRGSKPVTLAIAEVEKQSLGVRIIRLV